MALDKPQLTADMEDLLDGTIPMATVAAAGAAWATVMSDYAATGTANAVEPVISSTIIDTLGDALAVGFSVLPGDPGNVANAISAALTAFWLGVVFAGGTPPAAAGGPALSTALEAVFSVVGGTHASKATAIANAIDIYTKTVSVTFGPTTVTVI